jgi:hypothetical protein
MAGQSTSVDRKRSQLRGPGRRPVVDGWVADPTNSPRSSLARSAGDVLGLLYPAGVKVTMMKTRCPVWRFHRMPCHDRADHEEGLTPGFVIRDVEQRWPSMWCIII